MENEILKTFYLLLPKIDILYSCLELKITKLDFYKKIFDIISANKEIFNTVDEYIQYIRCEMELNIYLENYNHLNQNHQCTDDIISDYFQDISKIPVLNINQEKALCRRIYNGDDDLKEVLYCSNLKLVVSIVYSEFRFVNIDKMDLIQSGNVGLLKAVDNFNYKLGNKFSTYATYVIRTHIMHYIFDTERNIRIPMDFMKKIFIFKNVSTELFSELNSGPLVEEVMKVTNIKNDEIGIILSNLDDTISLETSIEGNICLSDTIEDTYTDIASFVEEKEIKEKIHNIIFHIFNSYSKKNQKCIILRCGLFNNKVMTLKEVSDIVGVSSERVRQIVLKFYSDIEKSIELKKILGQDEKKYKIK